MKSPWRAWMGFTLLALLVLWPPLHILLSSQAGLNSWKLAGWGMYATIHPNRQGFTVLLACSPDTPLPEPGALVGPLRVRLIQDGKLVRLDSRALPAGTVRGLLDLTDRIKVLDLERDKQRILERLEGLAAGQCQRPVAYSLLFEATPRVSLLRGEAYLQASVYLHYPGEDLRHLGIYSSDEMNAAELAAELKKHLGQARLAAQ